MASEYGIPSRTKEIPIHIVAETLQFMTGYILEGIPLFIGGTMYQFPCPTEGQCRKKLFERYGWDIKIYSLWGYKRMFGVRYRCCTQCHLPLNKKVADWLNSELGYTSNDIEVDKDFMELLNGIE